MTTGAAATSRFVKEYTAAATQNSIMQTKNTRRPSRSRSRRARRTRKGQTCYICTQALHWKTKEGLVRMCACRGTAAGFAHVSCLAEQAKILYAEAEENNKVRPWSRWHTCSLCEQGYHGVVACALGWACWKTYVGRPEDDGARFRAMSQLGSGLSIAKQDEEALIVREAELSTLRRLGDSEEMLLVAQNNLAMAYWALGRQEEALRLRQEVYSGRLKISGRESIETLQAAYNYANSLAVMKRFEEARSLLRRAITVARRVLGESHGLTLGMRLNYATSLYSNDGATLDDLREALNALEEMEPTARRVFGGAHPITIGIEHTLRDARAALRARETPSPPPGSA